MGVSPFHRGRRAKRAWVEDSETLRPSGMVNEKLRDTLTHGFAGLAIAGLGLAIAGGVALTGASQATAVSETTTSMISAPDVSRAEPPQQIRNVDSAGASNSDYAKRDGGADNADGALNDSLRDGKASRNAVRAQLSKGLTSQKAKQRTESLQSNEQKASATSRSAVQKTRAEEAEKNSDAVQQEEKKRQDEKQQQAEQARKQAESAGGTLADRNVPNYSGPTSVSATGSGGAKPVQNYRIAARWGQVGSWSRYHTGIDLAAPIGTPIYAAADGVVVDSNGGGWAGIHVVIKHGNDATLYAHMANRLVAPGATVKAGQIIGYVGMTGRSFGPHLHFEHYPNAGGVGNPYSTDDPYTWMLSKGVRL